MALGRFRRTRLGEIQLTLGADEHGVLSHVLVEMAELLAESRDAGGDDAEEDDPLARALGIGTATEAPTDPALARLFPDGYVDDAEASADFRRYTEPGLRSAKGAALAMTIATLSEVPRRLPLTSEQTMAWLSALNDTRLVLGERLGVTEDLDALVSSLGQDDPRLALLWVYDRLSYLQETLVEALAGDL